MTGPADLVAILGITDEVHAYMLAKYRQYLGLQVAQPPTTWTSEMIADCNHSVAVIAEATNHRLSTEWDVDRYCSRLKPRQTGQNLAQESQLEAAFQPLYQRPFPILQFPSMITDLHGNILVWYLPGLMSKRLQSSLWPTYDILGKHIKINLQSKSWRYGPQYYKSAGDLHTRVGTINMSPGWFEQAHERQVDKIGPSAELKSTSDGQVFAWLNQTTWLGALSGGILGLLHPQQYTIGRAAMLEMLYQPDMMLNMDDTQRALQVWASPFTALSVVMNRQTPVHRDAHGRHPWMDLLLTHGAYNGCCMELRSLGIRLAYESGTAVAICGKVVPHAVSDCEGERACLAYYMRDSVHNRLGIPAGSWMNVMDL